VALLDPAAGPPRGPVSLVRTWLTVLRHPRAFFRASVPEGRQEVGLAFGMAVVAVEESVRLTLGGPVPVLGERALLSAVLWFGVAVLVVAPVALHLVAALQTLLLVPFAPGRGGVSETVQVVGYATAPCALAGLPLPAVRAVVAAWGAWLLAAGVAEVHGATAWRARALSALPAALVFGYGFRGFDALAALLARWYII
jgi:hypothetical protein